MHTFKKMKEILEKEYGKTHKKGGSPPKMTVEDKLYAALKYLREYRTMESIGGDNGVSKSTICESIQWVENTLMKDGTFKLPGKKTLKEADGTIEYTVIDVTESPINRPKKPKIPLFRQKEAAYNPTGLLILNGNILAEDIPGIDKKVCDEFMYWLLNGPSKQLFENEPENPLVVSYYNKQKEFLDYFRKLLPEEIIIGNNDIEVAEEILKYKK